MAFVLALLLNALAVAGLWLFDPTSADAQAVRPRQPVEVVFADPISERVPDPADEPSEFSELPPDREDVAPENPDFLSNLNSRARDRAEGGEETGMPRLEGDSEAPHVQLEDQSATSEPAEVQPPQDVKAGQDGGAAEHIAPSTSGVDPLDPAEGTPAEDFAVNPSTESSAEMFRTPATQEELILLSRSSITDVYQEEMSHPVGNVAYFGNVSLNTVAWAYAPWLQRFIRDFRRNWSAPYAYGLGLIHGFDLVEIEVAQNGRMLRADMLDHEGHESLSRASLAALNATAPFKPLPDDFPEESLILKFKLIYPEFKRR